MRYRSKALVTFAALVVVAVFGCGDDCDDVVTVRVVDTLIVVDTLDAPPSPPDGFFSITGNGYIELYWNPNPEPDLAGYDLFWSDAWSGTFDYMVSVGADETSYIDYDVMNGTTYYYQIRAYDLAENTSDFCDQIVFDTPRPSGTGLVLHDYLGPVGGLSGYDFSEFAVQAWYVATTDVYFGFVGGTAILFGKGSQVGEGVDVQDYGFIDLDFVDWAPDILDGWSPTKRVELIGGHSYVIQIEDGAYYQYAKVYVTVVSSEMVVLDWAYQEDLGNPELAPGSGDGEEPKRIDRSRIPHRK